MLAVAVSGTGDLSPLAELPLERFIDWVCNSGGKSIRIPLLSEVIENWEVARHLGDSPEVHQLWLKKRQGGEVTLQELSVALRDVLEKLPDVERPLTLAAASTMLLEPRQLRPECVVRV